MAAIPARQASVTYAVGDAALTVAAVRAIIRKRALAAADLGLVDLMGEDLDRALDALSTHSLRVGLPRACSPAGKTQVRSRRHCAGRRSGRPCAMVGG